MYIISKSPISEHIGTRFTSVDPDQILTFVDGTVLVVKDIFSSQDGLTVIANTSDYQLIFNKME